MTFKVEGVMSAAMLVFKERVVTVLINSPLHADDVAVVELFSPANSFEGAICLRALVQFAGLVNLPVTQVWLREQNESTIELWLIRPKPVTFADVL